MTVTSEKIATLNADLLHYESRIKATEQTLANLKEIYRRMVEGMPKAMDAPGSESHMSGGRRISVGMDIPPRPQVSQPNALEWLGKSRQGFKASEQSGEPISGACRDPGPKPGPHERSRPEH
jgi:hypothetical protein